MGRSTGSVWKNTSPSSTQSIRAKTISCARLSRGLLLEDEKGRWDTPDGAVNWHDKVTSSTNVTPESPTTESQAPSANIPVYNYHLYSAAPENPEGQQVTVLRPDGTTYTYIQRTNLAQNVIYNYDQSKLVYVQPFQPSPNVQYIFPANESSAGVRPSFVTVQRSLSPNSNERAPTVVSTSVEIRRGSSIPYAGDKTSVLKRYEIKDDKLVEVEVKPGDAAVPEESQKEADKSEDLHSKEGDKDEAPKKEEQDSIIQEVEQEEGDGSPGSRKQGRFDCGRRCQQAGLQRQRRRKQA